MDQNIPYSQTIYSYPKLCRLSAIIEKRGCTIPLLGIVSTERHASAPNYFKYGIRSRSMAVVRTSRVNLQVNGNNAYAFVAQPDDNQKHPGIVLIQEWWGIEPHIVDLAQKLATDW